MNFLRRSDNRVMIKDDPANKMGAPDISKNEIIEMTVGGENDGINVSNQDPEEYEIDPSQAKSKGNVTPVMKSSKKSTFDFGNTPDGRKETPRLFQRRLFQRTPPKTLQSNKSDKLPIESENNDNAILSSSRENDSTGSMEMKEPSINEPSHESSAQQDGQPVPYTRTIEPWENWDEDFYSLLSTSMNFVSDSAITLACALASASSRLTADLIEVENAAEHTLDSKPKNENIEKLDSTNNDDEIISLPPTNGVSYQSKATTDASIEQKYNNFFTLNFIKELAHVGLALTYYDTSQEDFESILVLMKIEPGMKEENQLLEPKISWVQLHDGTEKMSTKRSIKILDIHSITAPESESISSDEGASLHFIITTETGDVHVFESVTGVDRDRALHGLRNMIAWLTYNLLTGSLVAPKVDEAVNKEYALSLGSQLKSMNHLLEPFLA